MTDVVTDEAQEPTGLSAADEQLLRELTERAEAGGLQLTGEGGLLWQLTKMVVEGALEGEMDDHLGYSRHDPAGRDGGNSRNAHRAKTVITEAGFPCGHLTCADTILSTAAADDPANRSRSSHERP